jgi:hypothetical protein
MARKSNPRKRYKPTEMMVACRSVYGHLKIGIEAVGSADKFNVYVEDARIKGQSSTHSAEFEGSARDALAATIEIAKKYLESRGEPSDHETNWECNDLSTMKPIPAPRLINREN